MKRLKVITILFLLNCGSCSEKSYESSRSPGDNDLINALTYHHEFEVSALVDDLAKTGNIDKKIQTERVAPTTNFWTPLCFASLIGNAKAVELLIAKGANINYKDSNGQTPLILASYAGNIEEIEILLQAGGNINEVDIDNNTALIHASAEGNLLTVKYLIEHGCDLGSKNGGQNALDFARFWQHKKVVEYLTEKGLKNSDR